jgi:hypothetical protein
MATFARLAILICGFAAINKKSTGRAKDRNDALWLQED